MSVKPLRIIQISDIHLFEDKNKELLGVKTNDSLLALLDLIKTDNMSPSLILLSGDLSQDGSEATYIRIADLLKEFEIPVYCVPGNHDNSTVMDKVYPRNPISNQRHIILEHWHLILLDSHKPGAVEGYLEQKELDFLQTCLQTYPEHPAIVVFHHHPFSVKTAWLDKLGLTNADVFWQLLSTFPSVKTVLFGHVHQQFELNHNGIACYATPSTCIQFKGNCKDFALEELAPAYRWIDLYPNGKLTTGVRRTAHYVGKFDRSAKGY